MDDDASKRVVFLHLSLSLSLQVPSTVFTEHEANTKFICFVSGKIKLIASLLCRLVFLEDASERASE